MITPLGFKDTQRSFFVLKDEVELQILDCGCVWEAETQVALQNCNIVFRDLPDDASAAFWLFSINE